MNIYKKIEDYAHLRISMGQQVLKEMRAELGKDPAYALHVAGTAFRHSGRVSEYRNLLARTQALSKRRVDVAVGLDELAETFTERIIALCGRSAIPGTTCAITNHQRHCELAACAEVLEYVRSMRPK